MTGSISPSFDPTGRSVHHFDDASDATTFSDLSPPVAGADSGISTARNVGWPGATGDYYLVLSYVGLDDSIWVYRLGLGGWDGGTPVATGMTAAESTSITAYQDTFSRRLREADGWWPGHLLPGQLQRRYELVRSDSGSSGCRSELSRSSGLGTQRYGARRFVSAGIQPRQCHPPTAATQLRTRRVDESQPDK